MFHLLTHPSLSVNFTGLPSGTQEQDIPPQSNGTHAQPTSPRRRRAEQPNHLAEVYIEFVTRSPRRDRAADSSVVQG